MRWRFIDANNRSEAEQRGAVVALIDSWWREFQAKRADIAALFTRQAQWDLPEWMAQHLHAISPRLMWEYGPAVRGSGHRLVITPESAHHLRPLVRTLLARAPALEGWEFYEHRLAEDLEQTKAAVEGRTGRGIDDLQVRVSIGEQNRIDLVYTAPDIQDAEEQTALNAAFVATETLLGEECLDRWIGAIEITPLPRPKGLKALFGRKAIPHFVGLERLADTVHAAIGSLRDQLPPNPHYEWAEDSQWTLWELKPDEADDYVGQHDLFVAKSVNPAQWTAAHSPAIFSSERFSRCGETFCYVKLDGSQGFDEEAFADKSEIEDALDAVLKPERIGCHMGGGTGLRYSYIDLALTDVDNAIAAVRRRLQAGNVPKRSWILFHDSDLAAEWIGIYDDSPPPPMDVDEQEE